MQKDKKMKLMLNVNTNSKNIKTVVLKLIMYILCLAY